MGTTPAKSGRGGKGRTGGTGIISLGDNEANVSVMFTSRGSRGGTGGPGQTGGMGGPGGKGGTGGDGVWCCPLGRGSGGPAGMGGTGGIGGDGGDGGDGGEGGDGGDGGDLSLSVPHNWNGNVTAYLDPGPNGFPGAGSQPGQGGNGGVPGDRGSDAGGFCALQAGQANQGNGQPGNQGTKGGGPGGPGESQGANGKLTEDRRSDPNNENQQSCNQGQADNCAVNGGVPDPVSCNCDMGDYQNWGYSPILIDLKGNGFELTNLAQGVKFDLNRDGIKEKLSWTKARSDEGFLVLDRNGNGTIDNGTELFGNFTPQPYSTTRNGFAALAVFDGLGKGGNNDGAIDNQDKIYKLLRLWIDYNQNGISESDELIPLKSVGLSALSLNYNSRGAYTDQYGNEFKYRSKIDDTNGTHIGHWAWDVFLLHQ